jgi:hypothetical protein
MRFAASMVRLKPDTPSRLKPDSMVRLKPDTTSRLKPASMVRLKPDVNGPAEAGHYLSVEL